jgi:hypothetical protein
MSNSKLLRQQLAKFVPDPRTLRALEQALETTQVVTPDYIAEVSTAAANAESTAVQALGQIEEARQSLAIIAGAADDKATEALQQLAGIIQDAAINAESAEVKATTALSLLKDIQQSVQLLEQAPPQLELIRHAYGSFYDTTTQTAAAINTAYAMTFNTTDLSSGVYVGSPTSRIYVVGDGVYNFQFSAQLDKTTGGVGLIYIWFRVNGSDIANSASQVRLQNNNAELLAAWNIILKLKAGDYFEIMWSVDDLGVILLAQAAAAPVPGIPSVILTVTDNISTGSR